MKKISALLFVALVSLTVCVMSATAQANQTFDLTKGVQAVQSNVDTSQIPTGKWLDEKWDGLWVIEQGGNFKLYKNGELVFDFTGKMKDLKVSGNITSGLTVTFSCDETERDYTFTKGVSLSKDLELTVNNHGLNRQHKATIKFQN
ncbi:MAG: hypothetical protein K6E51_04720 [Treponema sp.]|nr:hypothetical protein [Treponema sp.]